MRFRGATGADAMAVATLHAESWRAHYRGAYRDEYLDGDVVQDRIHVWKERLSTPAPNQIVVLAEEDDDLIGFACAYGGHDESWGSLLDNIHVRPEHQRRGVGAALVGEVAGWCPANYAGCGLYLWVLEQNRAAQPFYQRLGASDQGGEILGAAGRRADPRAPLRVEGRSGPRAAVSDSVRKRCLLLGFGDTLADQYRMFPPPTDSPADFSAGDSASNGTLR